MTFKVFNEQKVLSTYLLILAIQLELQNNDKLISVLQFLSPCYTLSLEVFTETLDKC